MRFSIIIPAYNSEQFIRKALDSIKAQTFKDYELIVVCDSCKDNTEEVAKSYGAKTVAVNYHLDGLTRNKGIDMAQGEWLLFMDDDDWWIHEYVLEQLDARLKRKEVDVLRFGFEWKGKGYFPPGDYYAVWNKVWRRSFVGDTRFSDRKWWSDVDFHNAMKAKGPRVENWSVPMYFYNYMREGSISWQNGS